MIKRAALVVGIILAASTIPVGPSSAAPAPRHCVHHVVGQRPDGQLILSSERCHATFDGAMRAEHVTAWGAGASAEAARSGVAMASFTLATHFDYSNLNAAGGSISIVGTTCGGGFTNMSSDWNNRVSSTANGCPNVTHYNYFNMAGSFFTTTGGGGNVGSLSNLVSSVRYW